MLNESLNESRNHSRNRSQHVATLRLAVRLLAVVALLLVSATALRADRTRTIDRVLPWSGGAVNIDHRFGSVQIRVSAEHRVVLHATLHASDDELLNQIRIVTVATPNGVSLRTEYPETVKSFFFSRYDSYAADLELTVPQAAVLYVRNKFGSLDVDGVRMASDLATAHGSFTFRNATGAQTLENSFGSIDVASVAGDVTVRNTNGNVTVRNITGNLQIFDRFGKVTVEQVSRNASVNNANGSVDLTHVGGNGSVTTSFAATTIHDVKGSAEVISENGEVDLNQVGGRASVKTSFAPVRFTAVGGDVAVVSQNGAVRGDNTKGSINVRTSFSPVELSAVGTVTVTSENGSVTVTGAGVTKVRTTFAPVFLRDVAGPVTVENQNGAISVESVRGGGRCAAVSLRTSFAPIEVVLPPGGYTVSAQTSFGSINTEIPITSTSRSGSSQNSTLNGTIGNGECRVDLVDQNGNIRIGR